MEGGESIVQTIFETKALVKEKISIEELMDQHGKILPKREELSVINYNMGYPYGGYDYYQSSYHVPNHYIDNHRDYDFRMDCYGNYYDDRYHPAKYDHDDWKYDRYDWKDDKYDDDYWKRMDDDRNILHSGYSNYDPYRYDAYSPYSNTYAGYYGSPYSGYYNSPYGTYV